ncbi:hypothetical protein HK105_206752 [Polyrhizophydium stewartii]|uniref:Ankyrin repeat protein n=1 Tax=Polyrhizophydium stewartii TaxID=2732419 RepID=A0ABR4N2I4_9FUNG
MQLPPSTTSDAARAVRFRPSATNEWDRMPAEIQNMILDAAGPFTKFVNGLLLAANLWGMTGEQRIQLWQDAIDVDWQGDLKLLPDVDITSDSLRMSRSIWVRIKDDFYDFDVRRIAIRNCWVDLIDFDDEIGAASAAAFENAVWLLEDVIDVRKLVKPIFRLAEDAALFGQLEALKFLHERMQGQPWRPSVGEKAANSGNLDLVVWLSEHRPECFDASAFEGAAWGDHIHIARWLAEKFAFACDLHAFDCAARNNNFSMIQFLEERFPQVLENMEPEDPFVSSDIRVLEWLQSRNLIVPREILQNIAGDGKIDVLEWAMARFRTDLQEDDLIFAHNRLHNHLLKWAYHRGVPFTLKSAEWAADKHNADLMAWLISRDAGLIPLLAEATAGYGGYVLMEWWREQHGVVFGQRELEAATRKGNMPIARRLLALDDAEWDLDAARFWKSTRMDMGRCSWRASMLRSMRLLLAHDRLAERLDGQPAPPPAVSPPLAAAPASTTSQPPSTTSDAARAVRFRPSATNEWDRMPAEIQNKILAHAGVLTLWLNGRIDDANLDVDQFKSMLVDVFELDWQGNLTTLPFKKFRYANQTPLRHMRTRSMHARIKVLGLRHLKDALDQAAILNGWTDLLNFKRPDEIAYNSACCGSIAMLEHLADERKVVELHEEHARLAAEFGHLEMLKWLHERMLDDTWTTEVMESAACSGHLDCVEFLNSNRMEGCTNWAMDGAARNGHLAVVKFLHANRTEGCTANAINDAAFNGHLTVVKWLYENLPRRRSGRAIVFAAQNDHADVVEWLLKNCKLSDIADAAAAAAGKGHLSLVQRIHALASSAITAASADEASSFGHVSVLEWLVNKAGVMPSEGAISRAVANGNVRMLPWFRNRMPDMFRAHLASKVGNESADAVIDWFDREDLPLVPADVMRLAIKEQQILVVKWLLEHMDRAIWHKGDQKRARKLVGVA